MGLLGRLETFTVADALRLLGATRKTGCLRIEGERRQGDVWLRDGALVDATIDRGPGGGSSLAEVIFEMLRLEEGSFRFVPAVPSVAADRQPEEIEGTLGRATALLDEWRELTATVPSLHHRVAMSPELPDPPVTLDARRWRALVAIADGPTVLAVARTLGLGELDVLRTINDLIDIGVAVVPSPSPALASLPGRRVDTGEVATRHTPGSDPAPRTGPHHAVPGPDRHPRTGEAPIITSPTS